jgi:hypothetical protein
LELALVSDRSRHQRLTASLILSNATCTILAVGEKPSAEAWACSGAGSGTKRLHHIQRKVIIVLQCGNRPSGLAVQIVTALVGE